MTGEKKRANIALFVPHNGCPHQCSFCDQRSITGVRRQPTADDVHEAVREAARNESFKKFRSEIAFFGGSFTAIDREYMKSLLKAAYVYVKNGTVEGIRLSTRPDCIDDEVLDILSQYGVTAIELGAQSMDDHVLSANQRGHTANDVEKASLLIKERGFSLGLQMMTGLYKSTPESDITTAEKIIALRPDTVRIYPTVVLKNTLLGELYEKGVYRPMTLSESVDLCAELLELFAQNSIKVIRLGLHYSSELVSNMVCDNYHPAFRELCESKLMLDRFFAFCEKEGIDQSGYMNVYVNPSCVSKFVGQRRSNLELIRQRGIYVKTIGDNSVLPFDMRPEIVSGCKK